jgi:outer membrane protein insertion porin family
MTNLTGQQGDALGGTVYWGASLEFQTPLYFVPKETGIKVAAFIDSGSLWDYRGPTAWLNPNCKNGPVNGVIMGAPSYGMPGCGAPGTPTGEALTLSNNNMFVDSAIGVGLLWASPFGPLRFDLAYPLSKQSFDRKQVFRFGGGGTF